jgi:hypothetical protein
VALAARPQPGARPAQNRDVNLDIGERVRWRSGHRRHGPRAVPRRELDRALLGQGEPAPGAYVIRQVEGSRAEGQLARLSATNQDQHKPLEGTRRKPWKSRTGAAGRRRHLFVVRTIKIVPQQHAWVVERLGKYDRT